MKVCIIALQVCAMIALFAMMFVPMELQIGNRNAPTFFFELMGKTGALAAGLQIRTSLR